MRAHAMVLVASAALVAGCAVSRGGVPANATPDDARLRARLEVLYAAWASGDDETAYAVFTPLKRARLSLEEYKRGREDARRADPGLEGGRVTLHAVTQCGCGDKKIPDDIYVVLGAPSDWPAQQVLRCVLLVDGSFIARDGGEERAKFLMVWEQFGDGEWYYFLIEDGEQCPRPNP